MKYLRRLYEGVKCREPVATAGLVRMALIVGVAFGLQLSPAQIVAVYAFAEYFLTWWLRGTVVSQDQHNEAVSVAIRMPYTATPEDVKEVVMNRRDLEALNKE